MCVLQLLRIHQLDEIPGTSIIWVFWEWLGKVLGVTGKWICSRDVKPRVRLCDDARWLNFRLLAMLVNNRTVHYTGVIVSKK